jgi:isomerase DpgB
MVTAEREGIDMTTVNGVAGPDLVLRIDGAQPLSIETIRSLTEICDRADDQGGPGSVRIELSGTPAGGWTGGLDVALFNKWERALRRLERLAVTPVAVARGACGGTALDALLATDYRVATPDFRLVIPVEDGATWPGMAVYRLVQQAGVARIRRAVLFGIPIGAPEALELHLIDELAQEPGTVAELIGGFSGPDLAIRRQLMLDATTTSFEEALGSHLAACDRALRRAAGAEAVAS